MCRVENFEAEFFAESIVIAADIVHQREEIGMAVNWGEEGVAFKGALVRQAEFGGATDCGDGFFGFAAESVGAGGVVNRVVKM